MWRGLTFLLPFLFFGHVSLPFSPRYCASTCILGGFTPACAVFCLFQKVVDTIFAEKCAITFTVERCCERERVLYFFFPQFWQLYNSVTLFCLAGHADCKEWQVRNGFNPLLEVSLRTNFFLIKQPLQVFMLALTFLVLFLGNFLTTLKVVHQKFQKNQEKAQKNDWTRRETDLLQKASKSECTHSLGWLTRVGSQEKTKLKTPFPSPAFTAAVSSYRRADAQSSVRMVDQ